MSKWLCKRCSSNKPSEKMIMGVPFCGGCGKYLMTPVVADAPAQPQPQKTGTS